LQYLVLSPKK